MEIDTEQFHPFNHRIYSRRCGQLPGGRLNHLYLWWEYEGKCAIKRWTLCRLGRHEWSEVFDTLDFDTKNTELEWSEIFRTSNKLGEECWNCDRLR